MNHYYISYKKPYIVEPVQFAYDTPIKVSYKGENLFNPFNELKLFLEKDDPEVETGHEGMTSHKLGIGAWYPHLADDPEAISEAVIIFEEEYYK